MPRIWVLTSLLVVALAAAAWRFWPEGPVGVSLLEDSARLMSVEQGEHLQEYHAFLLLDHDIDYRVVTANDVGDINLYATKQFAALGVGNLSRSGRGLLLVIDPAQDRVRLEVSQGLEGVYMDAFVAYLEQRQMVPFFRVGRVADGILATTELIITRAQNAKANAGFEGEGWAAASGGAGAATAAKLDAGADTDFRDGGDVAAGTTPEATLEAYYGAMAARNLRGDLDLFTPATRKMFENWVVTAAQADNTVRSFRKCHQEPARYDDTGRYAVIRFPVDSPYFLEQEDGRWRLDLVTMQKAVRFNVSNQWHFDLSVEHPYGFAFADWSYDKHGFPYRWRWNVTVAYRRNVGPVITRVGPGSPAEQLGLQVNDRLISWDGETIEGPPDAIRAMAAPDEGDRVVVVVERDGEERTLETVAPPR